RPKTKPVAPPPAQPAAQPAAPVADPAAAPAKRGFGAGALVAMVAVGALVGGASGAGITAWALAFEGVFDPAPAGPQTITVNDPDSVNTVNAVAAKASPSVVTLNVRSDRGAG